MLTKPKPKTKYITPQEFLEFPLSKAIIQVIEDVRQMRKLGIDINMDMWWYPGRDNTKPCAVCLGGAALCSFDPGKVNGYQLLQYGEEILGITREQADTIACTFDNIRSGSLARAMDTWYTDINRTQAEKITRGIQGKGFYGRMGSVEFDNLIEYLQYISKELRKRGY